MATPGIPKEQKQRSPRRGRAAGRPDPSHPAGGRLQLGRGCRRDPPPRRQRADVWGQGKAPPGLPQHSCPLALRETREGFYGEQLVGQEENWLSPSSGMGLTPTCLASAHQALLGQHHQGTDRLRGRSVSEGPHKCYVSAHNTEGKAFYKREKKGKINKYIPSIPVSGVNDLVALPQ